jgi:hypothetical protein
MDTLILTEQQAAELEAANGNSNRRLKPRRLADGRLILNADILDDPFFTDRTRGWAAILLAPVEQVIEQEITEQAESGPDVEVGQVGLPVEATLAAGIQRVTLSPQELI